MNARCSHSVFSIARCFVALSTKFALKSGADALVFGHAVRRLSIGHDEMIEQVHAQRQQLVLQFNRAAHVGR